MSAWLLLGCLFLGAGVGCGDSDSEAIVDDLQLTDFVAYWAVRGKDREQNNYIHPVVRFRIKNESGKPAGYIQAMAVFKRESLPDESWGNAFLYSVSDEPIAPGAESDLLTLRADTNFISKDAPEEMFENEKWENVSVEIFLRVGPSHWRPALTAEVPKHIGAPGLEKFLNPDAETP
jgi:hypothetical protein